MIAFLHFNTVTKSIVKHYNTVIKHRFITFWWNRNDAMKLFSFKIKTEKNKITTTLRIIASNRINAPTELVWNKFMISNHLCSIQNGRISKGIPNDEYICHFLFSAQKNSWLHFPYNNSLFENDFLMKQSHVKKNKIPIQKFDAVASQLI